MDPDWCYFLIIHFSNDFDVGWVYPLVNKIFEDSRDFDAVEGFFVVDKAQA